MCVFPVLRATHVNMLDAIRDVVMTRIFPCPSGRRSWLVILMKLYLVNLVVALALDLVFWAIDGDEWQQNDRTDNGDSTVDDAL